MTYIRFDNHVICLFDHISMATRICYQHMSHGYFQVVGIGQLDTDRG